MQWAYSLLAKGDVRAVRAIAELDLQLLSPCSRGGATGNRTFAEAAQAALAQLSEPSEHLGYQSRQPLQMQR